MGLVIDQAATGMTVIQDDKPIGEIRSQTWSPKYNKQLAFAMLDYAGVKDQTHVMVFTDDGLVKARIAPVPFDFDALGMTAHAK